MRVYLSRRVLALIPLLLGASFLTFALGLVTPSDPVVRWLSSHVEPAPVPPVPVQFGRYVWDAVHGNLGLSLRGQTPVAEEILKRIPSTLQLTIAATIFCLISGVALGLIAATTKHRSVDRSAMGLALAGLSVPNYWVAIVLIIVSGIQMDGRFVSNGPDAKYLILPAVSLSIAPAAAIARVTRASMREALRSGYVRTARGKGLGERLVMARHALRNAMIPVVAEMGLLFGAMLGGTVFIESAFSRAGVGSFALYAIQAHDYPQVQGLMLFLVTSYVLVRFAVELLHGFLDPRIRSEPQV